jgi:hypothetical protein
MTKSIWGEWWTGKRKWVYPAWLAYEATARIHDYAMSVHEYLEEHHYDIASYVGNFGSRSLDFILTNATFTGCELMLTAPACLAVYKFFEKDNLTDTALEERIKRLI